MTNNVTKLAMCHSWLLTWAWQHAHTIVFIKWKPQLQTRIYTRSCEFQKQRQKTTYLSLHHVSLHAWSVLLGAVGPPNGETVRLALLFDLTGGCAVSTFNRHHSSVTSLYALPTWNWAIKRQGLPHPTAMEEYNVSFVGHYAVYPISVCDV